MISLLLPLVTHHLLRPRPVLPSQSLGQGYRLCSGWAPLLCTIEALRLSIKSANFAVFRRLSLQVPRLQNSIHSYLFEN